MNHSLARFDVALAVSWVPVSPPVPLVCVSKPRFLVSGWTLEQTNRKFLRTNFASHIAEQKPVLASKGATSKLARRACIGSISHLQIATIRRSS